MRRLWREEPVMGKLESRNLFVHALRFSSSEIGNPYIKGEIFEYGHMDSRSS
jgi:hypothetical protein